MSFLVIGAGFTGATVARLLADAGRKVIVVERRPHVGGNASDYLHDEGYFVNRHGPHYFRTSSQKVWDFVRRFGEFRPFVARVKSKVDGVYYDWPITREMLDACSQKVPGEGFTAFLDGPPKTFEQAMLRQLPSALYEKFIRGYTWKQWGVPPDRLSADLARRVDIRDSPDPSLKTSTHQGLPVDGYTALIKKMLEGIEVHVGHASLPWRSAFQPMSISGRKAHLVYTGPIDEYFGFDLGRLQYRAQTRHDTLYTAEMMRDRRFVHPTVQTNCPEMRHGYVREIEWKHMAAEDNPARLAHRSLVTREYPRDAAEPDGFEYPFPDWRNRELYRKYEERARGFTSVTFCGRLGTYKYLDMDGAIAKAMTVAERLLEAT